MSADDRFVAKTWPYRKSIQEHTDDLLHNLEILKQSYPNLNTDWDMLQLACIYHDLGKMNTEFQEAIHENIKHTGMPHGLLSLGFIDADYLETKGYNEKDIKILYHAVAYHHERNMSYTKDEIYDKIRTIEENFKEFEYDKLPTRFLQPEFDILFFKPGQRLYEDKDETTFFKYVMLKGLLNRLDYAASSDLPVERKNDFLLDAMSKLLSIWREKNSHAKWNSMQEYMLGHQNDNVIVVAQTGMGKTEAGLLWLGNNKGFYTLPIKSAINAIYKRICDNIIFNEIENRIGLLHSDTLKVYYEREEEKIYGKDGDDTSVSNLEYYYSSTRQLSLPLTICTLDQIFDFVYRYKGFEPKLATLSYSKIIIDEIQMYAPELVAYLIAGLTYITRLGGKYAILTATLPDIIIDFMKNAGLTPPKPVVFTNDLIRHSIKMIDASINADESIAQIAKAFSGNKVLVICNTIRMAKEVYEKLINSLVENEKCNIHLLHSGFIRRDRKIKEDHISATGKSDSGKSEIWVSTQLVEASLDIDFDLLFTELSDLNGLFQRMGRCYRNRTLDKDYNCFVFTGGSTKCSGVGENLFIEPEIFNLSKETLVIEGIIDEETKVKLINNTYSSEKLKGTKYYKRIKEMLTYVNCITEFEYTKQQVSKMFRDIDQVMVIPQTVFHEHENETMKCINIIQDRSALNFKERVKAKETIRDYMVPVNTRLAEGTCCKREYIERGLELIIVDAEYDNKTGIAFCRTRNKDFQSIENRMF